jgi:hypothetical protein
LKRNGLVRAVVDFWRTLPAALHFQSLSGHRFICALYVQDEAIALASLARSDLIRVIVTRNQQVTGAIRAKNSASMTATTGSFNLVRPPIAAGLNDWLEHVPIKSNHALRHARACRGHPRLNASARTKAWMAGT